MAMPQLEEFVASIGLPTSAAAAAPAIKAFDNQLTEAEWRLYGQLSVVANRRLMLYDLMPALQNDPAALAYHQLWHAPQLVLPNNVAPARSLLERWQTIADKLGKAHPHFLDRD